MEYPAKFTADKENGGFVVTFPDLPGVTEGDTIEEAMEMASEALGLALTEYVERNLDLPTPGKLRRGMKMVRVSALKEAKFGLYNAMRTAGVRKAELARRLRCQRNEVERLLDPFHGTKIDQIEQALAAVGKRLVVEIRDAKLTHHAAA
jgi:antitoxin HicB